MNTSINNQIILSQNNIIGELLQINSSITNQMNLLNQSLTNQLIQLNNQLLNNANLTTEQYNNLTIQISNIGSQINFTAINLQLADLNFSISQLQNTANAILSAQNQMNNTINNIYADLISLNNTMFVQFGITNALIIETYNNLTSQINYFQNLNINQFLIINQTLANITSQQNITQSWIQNIYNWLINILNPKIDNLTNNVNILLNQTTSVIIIYPNTNNCITGSDWILQARTVNENNIMLDNSQIYCIENNDVNGNNSMNYTFAIQK
jgi:hypothetical protein